MARSAIVATVCIKVLKIILNVVCLILYRTGMGGQFLGIGGTWNLNEDKNPDAEILGSGIMVGFLVYHIMILISYCLTSQKTALDVLMNIAGVFLWVAIAGTCLHYWQGYRDEYKFRAESSERSIGLALGSLLALSGVLYIADCIFSFKLFSADKQERY